MTWRQVSIGKVASKVTKGTTPTTLGYKFVETGIPFIRVQNLVNGSVDVTAAPLFIDCETHQALERSQILKGDLLVSIAGTIGRPAIVDTDGPFNCNQAVAIVRLSDEVDRRYVLRWLSSVSALKQMTSKGVTGTITNLSLTQIKSLQIPLPPLPEQKRIAAILDKADELRAKRREAIGELDKLVQATFLDMFGDPATNPKEWPEKSLGEIVAQTKLGLVRSSSDFGWDFRYRYVRMDAVTTDGQFLPDKVQFTDASEPEIEHYGLKCGDVLFNTRNSKELVGKVCVFRGEDGWLYNNNLMRIRFKEGVYPEVVVNQFRFPRVKTELEKRKSGTTNVFAIYWKNLKTLPVLLPPTILQCEYSERVSRIYEQRQRSQKHLELLDELFASLQHRAFNGEL